MKKKILIGIGFIILVIIGITINLVNKQPKKVEVTKTNNTYSETDKIMCQIKGEVIRPGVYNLDKGSRLQDLILAAGGFTSTANTNSVSLVSILEDSACYTIDKVGSTDTSSSNNLININTATKEELMGLAGIGEAKAEAIINYRKQNGYFTSVNDLTKVSGISDKVLSQIIDKICIR